MDIQKDKDFTSLPEIAKLYQACKERDLTIAEREYLKGARDAWQAAKAQAVPNSPTEKTWDEIHLDPKERLYWSLRSAKKRKSDLNWSHASHQTCVGSTHGRKICEYLGVDPDGKDFVRTQEPAND